MFTAIALAAVVFFASCSSDDNGSPNVAEVDMTFSPKDNATNVALNKSVSANFSKAMNPASFNNNTFTVREGNNEVAGTVSYTGFTALFLPNVPLKQNTLYTANISREVKLMTGESIPESVNWKFTTGTNATGLAKINLGAAGGYVILAKTAVSNVPTSAITGDVALSPAATSFITGLSLIDNTGYANSSQVTGNVYAADMTDPTPINLTTAVENMVTAYHNIAGLPSPDFTELGAGNIGGQTLVPGLYKWTSNVTIPTDIMISGSATDVWIFQIAGNLNVGSAVNIALSGGAKAENIFWQVSGTVTIETTANFKGVILSMTGITLKTGAVLTGRALAQTAVTLDQNTVTQP